MMGYQRQGSAVDKWKHLLSLLIVRARHRNGVNSDHLVVGEQKESSGGGGIRRDIEAASSHNVLCRRAITTGRVNRSYDGVSIPIAIPQQKVFSSYRICQNPIPTPTGTARMCNRPVATVRFNRIDL